MRQVSPESLPIFDFIIELYKFSSGEWHRLVDDSVENEELQRFLIYAATFLSNLGNYYACAPILIIVVRAMLTRSIGVWRPEIHSWHQRTKFAAPVEEIAKTFRVA